MDNLTACLFGDMNRGKELMVFDWDKAALIIDTYNPKWAEAGLKHDMDNTSGTIYEDGKPVMDDYTYLASTWATPILVLTDNDYKTTEIECFKMQSETPDWDAETKWPDSALKRFK